MWVIRVRFDTLKSYRPCKRLYGAQVVEAVAHAVSALPAEQRRAALEAMITPLVRPLQAALGAPGGREGPLPSPPASSALVIQLVDRLTVVFRCAGVHIPQFRVCMLCCQEAFPAACDCASKQMPLLGLGPPVALVIQLVDCMAVVFRCPCACMCHVASCQLMLQGLPGICDECGRRHRFF